jgi:hypothetical protein
MEVGMKTHTGMAVILLAALLAVAGCNRTLLGSRSDSDITADVQKKLTSNPAVSNKQIGVSTTNGVVTLSGQVANETERLVAANDAGAVEGVKTVVNDLTVANAAMPDPMPMTAAPARTTAPVRPGPRPAAPRPSSPAVASTIPDPVNPAPVAQATPPAPATLVTVTIPAGTGLTIALNSGLSSEEAQPGDRFSGTLMDEILVDGAPAVPRGAEVEGRVVNVKSAGKFAGQSLLTLKLTRLSYNGKSYTIDTDTWSKQGSSRGKNTAAKVGGGAAIGAVIGAIAGGGKGAAIGAAVGAGAGTTAQAVTKGQQIELKPEAALNFTLLHAVTVTPAHSTSR